MIAWDSPVTTVLGGKKPVKQKKFTEGLRLRTVEDLMRHFPRRYLKTGELTRVEELQEGEFLIVVGEIISSQVKTYDDRRTNKTAYRVETLLAADGARLLMTFFAKNHRTAHWQSTKLHVGRQGVFMGQVKRFRDTWQLTHPQMSLFGADTEEEGVPIDALGELFPIYPLTSGLENLEVIRAVAFARSVLDEPIDVIPESIRADHDVTGAHQAYEWIHAPDTLEQVERARHHFRFAEALITQIVMARRRRFVRTIGTFARTGKRGGLLDAFDARLPFELTGGQRSTGQEIAHELGRSHPMNRLLQGEVGSGKTLVALRAMLHVVDSGGQAALLAPTEVLAQQHHRSITELLGDLAQGGMLGGAPEATQVELLTGSMTKTERTVPMSRLASGEAGLVIGTHALLEQHVMFADLGLVVVDEQHRFGVEQRAALTDKAISPPHVLVMTATPIPRTVAMTVFGDLEVSTLTELPAGRGEVQTTVIDLNRNPNWLDRAWKRVREEVADGRQAYVVCPRIAGDDYEQTDVDLLVLPDGEIAEPDVPLAAVEEVVVELRLGELNGLRVEMLHGRMSADDKDTVMRAFSAGDIDVLVATTVIEVGVDVPNATTMVLLDADRFGVSQLHQLRGRIGRGGHDGLCLLVTRADSLSGSLERLDAVASTRDGFELSRIDLELRREGDVLGRSQSGGHTTLDNLRVLRDEDTIIAARGAAEKLLDEDPDLLTAPLLGIEADALEHSQEAGFMEKS